MFRPSAFAGEVVPFRTTAFREGHDLIGVHVRLFSPSGDESLHRLLPLHDGFDRWETAVDAARSRVSGRFRFEAFADDFATWEHAADLKIAAGVDTAAHARVRRPSVRARGGREVASDRRAPPSRERGRRRSATADVSDEASLEIVRDPSIAAFFAARPLTSLMTHRAAQRTPRRA